MAAPRQIAERPSASFTLFVPQTHAEPARRGAGFHLSIAIAAALLWLVLAFH